MDNSNVHPSLVDVANRLIGDSISACKLTIPLILIVILAYTTVSSLILGQEIKLDYKPLLRAVILMFVVAFYVEIMGVISSLISVFNNLFERPNDLLAAFQDLAETGTTSSGDPDENDGFWATIGNAWDGVFNLFHLLSSWVQEGLAFMVRAAISLIRSILLAFLYLIGPIAITISMVPGFRDAGLLWLKGFIGVQFWDLTLNILDNLVFAYQVDGFTREGMDVGYGLVVNIVIVIMYLMTPGLTNYFINTGPASSLWGRLGGIGASVLFFGNMLRGQRNPQKGASTAVDKKAQQSKSNAVQPTANK